MEKARAWVKTMMGQEDVEALGRYWTLRGKEKAPTPSSRTLSTVTSHYLADDRVLARGVRISSTETDSPNQSPPARFNTGRACHEGCL